MKNKNKLLLVLGIIVTVISGCGSLSPNLLPDIQNPTVSESEFHISKLDSWELSNFNQFVYRIHVTGNFSKIKSLDYQIKNNSNVVQTLSFSRDQLIDIFTNSGTNSFYIDLKVQRPELEDGSVNVVIKITDENGQYSNGYQISFIHRDDANTI